MGGIAAAGSSNGSRAEGRGSGNGDAPAASLALGVPAGGAAGEGADEGSGDDGAAGDGAKSLWIGSGNRVTADALSDGAGLERTIATVGGGVADVMGCAGGRLGPAKSGARPNRP